MIRGHRILVLVIIFLALQVLILHRAQAEYRVYRLGVKYTDKQIKENEVLTTLDDIQYMTYYKVTPQQKVHILQHWMCRGRTDYFKTYCPAPISKAAAKKKLSGPNLTSLRIPER